MKSKKTCTCTPDKKCWRHRPYSLKRSKIKSKPVSEEKKEERQVQRDKDNEFYSRIWAKRGPYSEISGTYLGAEVNKACIDHLCEKSKYPELRYEEDNILLVTIEEHGLKTNGFPLPKHLESTNKAKKRFNI